MSELQDGLSFGDRLRFGVPVRTALPKVDVPRTAFSAGSGVRWRRRYRMMLGITDTTLIVVMVFASGWLMSSVGGTAISSPTASVLMSVLVCAIWAAMMFLFHTRDPQLMGIGAAEYKRVIHSCAATVGWLAAVALLLGGDAAGGYLLMIFPVGAIVLVADRWTWRQWLSRQRRFGHYLSRVIVLGRDEDVRYVVRQIAKKSGAAYDVVGAVIEGDPGREAIQVDRQRIPLVSGLDDIPDAVTMAGADAVIVAGHLDNGSKYVRELGWKLEATATELVLASALTNVAGPRIRMRHVEGLPLMHVELPNFKGGRHVLKRALDIVVATLALIILAPSLCLLGLLVRHDSYGSAFFRQERVGRNGSTFCMYKFRSMVESAEDELALLANLNEGAGPLFKLRSDPRVTRIGAWLRRYSLDELPQFINVLKGDMSLVGPRPPLPSEVADYQGHVHRRLFIKPGITGLWQINGRSDLDWDESVRLDLYYVENWSLAGDLMIMWRTVKVMLRPTGAY